MKRMGVQVYVSFAAPFIFILYILCIHVSLY